VVDSGSQDYYERPEVVHRVKATPIFLPPLSSSPCAAAEVVMVVIAALKLYF
jgi:hypothetical protein